MVPHELSRRLALPLAFSKIKIQLKKSMALSLAPSLALSLTLSKKKQPTFNGFCRSLLKMYNALLAYYPNLLFLHSKSNLTTTH